MSVSAPSLIAAFSESDASRAAHAPHNLEVEAALLGALLRNNKTFEQIGEISKAAHFYHAGHARIFELIATFLEQGRVANEDTLTHHAAQDDVLSNIGGADYIRQLANNVFSVISVMDYAKLLKELHTKRQLMEIGESCTLDAANNLEVQSSEQIETVEQQLFSLAETGDTAAGAQALKFANAEAINQISVAIKSGGKLTGVTTGLKDIDNMLGGLHPSDLIVLAGRPAMGKSALAVNIAYNAAQAFCEQKDETGALISRQGARVAVFSLEMSAAQLASRILSAKTSINGENLRRGEINQEQFNHVARAAQEIDSLPLYIDDTPSLSVSAVRQRARRLKRIHGLDLIVLDYLQLLQVPSGQRVENRVQEISMITRNLKAIARELHVPVLALSQLSRAVESRDPPIPQLSDLRDSGAIEQDADVVMFIYRAEYYLKQKDAERRESERDEKFQERVERHQQLLEEMHNKAQIKIAKQRHGSTGSIDLFFNPDYTLFSDLAKSYESK